MKAVRDGDLIFLQPGDWYFGEGDVRVRTLLGSCVSITLWHEARRIGGMCHYLLPARKLPGDVLDGAYGEEAMALLLREIHRAGTRPEQYEAKVFGGGVLFGQSLPPRLRVGQNNVSLAQGLVQRHGFRLIGERLGGEGHRTIIFCLKTGDVLHRFTPKHGGADRLARKG